MEIWVAEIYPPLLGGDFTRGALKKGWGDVLSIELNNHPGSSANYDSSEDG
jgi:hypothetical protein